MRFVLQQYKSQLNAFYACQRVISVVSAVMEAGMTPIVIGGGHNNCFGLLTSANRVLQQKISAVNLDPHSDFRLREGRHSGNGFSYAADSGALGYYHVLGLHELKNSEATLQQLEDHGAEFTTFQVVFSMCCCAEIVIYVYTHYIHHTGHMGQMSPNAKRCASEHQPEAAGTARSGEHRKR